MIDGLKVWNKWGPISGSPLVNVSRVCCHNQNIQVNTLIRCQMEIQVFKDECLRRLQVHTHIYLISKHECKFDFVANGMRHLKRLNLTWDVRV